MSERKKIKVYTKRGDAGMTELYTGQKMGKDDSVFQVLGNVDTLSAFIGQAVFIMKRKNIGDKYIPFLINTQRYLINFGSCIGSMGIGIRRKEDFTLAHFAGEQKIKELEQNIDNLADILPRLTVFIIPQGEAGSAIHLCRTFTRQAERSLVDMENKYTEEFNKDLNYVLEKKYLNRLSDYFFQLAREVYRQERKMEEGRKKKKFGIFFVLFLLFIVAVRTIVNML